MKKRLIAIGALTLLLAAGCKNKNQPSANNAPASAPTTQAASVTPEQLGEIGAQIKRHPKEAQSILSDHGLTEESFERAIRQVSSDPAASKRYAAAFKRSI
jgi:hypothetical protein